MGTETLSDTTKGEKSWESLKVRLQSSQADRAAWGWQLSPGPSDTSVAIDEQTRRMFELTNIREYIDTQALARASQMDASGLA